MFYLFNLDGIRRKEGFAKKKTGFVGRFCKKKDTLHPRRKQRGIQASFHEKII